MSSSWTLPHGIAIRPAADYHVREHRPAVDIDESIEAVEHATFDADEVMVAAVTFIKAAISGATSGGVVLNRAELQAMCFMLDLVKTRTAAAKEAATSLALARLQDAGI